MTFNTCLCGTWKTWTIGQRYTKGDHVYTLVNIATKAGKSTLEFKPSRGQTRKVTTDNPELNSYVTI